MKKTLIALAAVAVSSAAVAQVTINGHLDLGLTNATTKVNGVKTVDNGTIMDNGRYAGGSRIRFSGSEDLDNGYKASFLLDQRLTASDGKIAGQTYDSSFIALSGGFGTVTLGRSAPAYNSADSLADSQAAADSGAFNPNGLAGRTVAQNNQIKYVAPSFAGVTVALSQILKGNKDVGSKNTNSLSVVYKTGPLTAAYGSETSATYDVSIYSAAYNLGVASVSFGTDTNQTLALGVKGNKTSGTTLGVTIPMGDITLSGAYGAKDVKTNVGVKVTEKTGTGFIAVYSLSKRTNLYGGFKNTSTKTIASGSTSKLSSTTVGMSHAF